MAERGPLSRILGVIAQVEPREVNAVLISFVYFFFLMASYFILRPLHATMGTVYGVQHLQELFTGTFVLSFVVAPLYAGLASRIKLASFLPWVYGFIALTMLGFFLLFQRYADNRWIAAAFYVWCSTYNLLTISVFWSMMADIFSTTQAKRLFGFIAAGGTVGTISAPAFVTFFVQTVGTNTLLLISAAGFAITALMVRLLEREKRKLVAVDQEAQPTSLDKRLGGSPFDGFTLLFRSRYLLMIALFLLLMTWISTVVYFQLQDIITKDFASRAARTQAFATIDLATNSILNGDPVCSAPGRFIQTLRRHHRADAQSGDHGRGVPGGGILARAAGVGQHPGDKALLRIRYRQAQPRHALHRGGPAGEIQS